MKILYVDNLASHYRKGIFLLMDNEFQIDYVFGTSYNDVKEMDTSLLNGRVEKARLKKFFGGYWQPRVIGKIFRHYDAYLLIGDTHAWSTWLFAIIAKCTFRAKHLYFWSHGWYGKENRIETFLKKLFFRLPGGGVFLYGNYARQLMIDKGFNADRLYTIHNSLSYDEQINIRKSLQSTDLYRKHFGNENNTIILIGRLNKRKKIELLIEAVGKLKEKGKSYNIVLVGDGSEKESLQNITTRNNIEKQVWFYGACYDELKNAELIYNADLCVTPGDVGLTAIHVLTYGTPCITHNNFQFQGPEFEAIIAGCTGDYYEHDNVESLMSCIEKWFSAHNERDIVRQSCYKEIDKEWTPYYQLEVLRKNLK